MMILPHKKARRFFTLIDLVTVFAHDHLHVVGDQDLFTREPPRGLSEYGQRLTLQELWKNTKLLEDFVDIHASELEPDDLLVARSWTNAYNTIAYFDRCADGRVRFFVDDYVIEVCGMSMDLDRSLPVVPDFARLTLLPFEEYIVYDMSLEQLPFSADHTMLDVFGKEMDAALASGHIIRTGYELCELAPRLKQQHLEAELERFRHDMEMEERANGPHDGQHRGTLAGLSSSERDKAIMAHMRELDTHPRSILEFIDDQCLEGEPFFALADLLEAEGHAPTAEEFEMALRSAINEFTSNAMASEEGIANAKKLLEEFEQSKEGNRPAELVAESLATRENVQTKMGQLTKSQIERMRKLAEAGGHLSYPIDESLTRNEIPVPVPGICYLFRTSDTYHVVMPEEIVPIALTIDWDEALETAHKRNWFNSFFDCIVELRGIVEIDEALTEYLITYGSDDKDLDALYEELLDAMETDAVGATLLDTGEAEYLLHYELLWMYREWQGKDPHTDEVVIEGPLGVELEGLLAQQRSKEPHPVTEEMLDAGSVFEWKMAQPPAQALLNYLDEHVPDDADDYFFAEKVLEDLLEEQQLGLVKGGVQRFFDILEDNGFVPDESQVQQLLTLWQNLCNGLPIWPNNGWSPNEVLGQIGNKPVFYNVDGSIMKIGRNDPCPCGSGKKYKRCCGR